MCFGGSRTTVNARELSQAELDSIALQSEIAREYLNTVRSESEWNRIARGFALEQMGIRPRYEDVAGTTTGGFTAGTPTTIDAATYNSLPADVRAQARATYDVYQPDNWAAENLGVGYSSTPRAEVERLISSGQARAENFTGIGTPKYTIPGSWTPSSTTAGGRRLTGFELTEEGLARQAQDRQARQLQTDVLTSQSKFLQQQAKDFESQSALNEALVPFILESTLGLSMTKDPTTGKVTLAKIDDSDVARYKEYSKLALERATKALKGELPVSPELTEGWRLAEMDLMESLRKQFGSFESAMETEGGQRAWKNFLMSKSASFDAAKRGDTVAAADLTLKTRPQYDFGTNIASKTPYGANPFQIGVQPTSPALNLANASSLFNLNPAAWSVGGELAAAPNNAWSAYRNYLGQVDLANAQISAGQSAGFGSLLGTAIGTAGGLYAMGVA